MDSWFSVHASDPHNRSLFEFDDDKDDNFGEFLDAPTEKGLHVHSGDPQEAEGLVDVYSPTDFKLFESADSANPSYLSGSTVCLSPGNHDGLSDQQTKLQHSDPHASSFSFWSASKPPQRSPAWRRRPSKSRNRPRGTGCDGGEDLESDGGWGGKTLRPSDSRPEPKLNCLFYLKDPVKHHQCSNCQFKDWAKLRDHLFRKHRQPAKNARDEQYRKTTSSGAAFEEPSDITEEQEYAIRSLTQRGKKYALEDVWRAGWNILFPASQCPPSPFSIQRRPQDDMGNLTEADSRLLASGEFRLWIQSFPGMSNVGEDQRAEICKELIQTFNARLLGQDTRLSQVSRREDGTDQDATLNPPAAIQREPCEFPQYLEFLEGEFGDSPSTSSVVSSADADTESPLFASIRRILSADPSYAAEDVILAIKKRSEGKTSASGSEPAIIDSLTSEAPKDQESTSRGTNKRPTSTSGQSNSPANKKQKTCTPSDADGDGSGNDGDGGGSDGGGGGGTPPRHTPDESFDGWICPYCLKYVEITCIKEFQACGRPGFRDRDDLRTHLARLHSPEAKARPKNLKKGLAQYYMSTQQWEDVKGVMDNIKRPQRKKDPQKWLEVQKTWYSKVWAILFPFSQYIPDSPFHLSNEALKERCHQVVEAMMDLECGGAQARDCSSSEDTPLFTPLQVRKMLEKSLQIGLDSIPIVAQHFGDREAVQATHTEPSTGAATTTPEDEAAGPTPDGSNGATPNTEAAAAETEGSSTPENTLPRIPKTGTPQPSPVPIALDTRQTFLQQTSDVLLENDGNITFVSIGFMQRNPLQATDQALVARVQVTAPSTFFVNIEDSRDCATAT